jgi:BCCT, betaine/carnitine/choline family transporter
MAVCVDDLTVLCMLSAWNVFYLAWWIVWAAFAGVFIASISRGRKLWEVALYTLLAPTGYCLVWFCVMGGVGLRQSRQALELERIGTLHFNDSGHFASTNRILCYDVPQEDLILDGALVFRNYLPGVTPVCLFDPDNAGATPYRILHSFQFPDSFAYSGMGVTLSILFIVGSALFGVTSCDSACLVVDNLASTGRKNMHWARRLFWSLTIGALATALISSGGADALQAVQAASVLCGLPFAFVMCYMMQSILLLCKAVDCAEKFETYSFPSQPEFNVPIYGGVFNIFEYVASLGKVNKARTDRGMDKPSKLQIIEFCKGLIVPFVSLHQTLTWTYPKNPSTNGVVVACYTLCYFGWISLLTASRRHAEFSGLGWTLLAACGCILSSIRWGFRARYKIRSNVFADVVSSTLIWPQVLAQMRIEGTAQEAKT